MNNKRNALIINLTGERFQSYEFIRNAIISWENRNVAIVPNINGTTIGEVVSNHQSFNRIDEVYLIIDNMIPINQIFDMEHYVKEVVPKENNVHISFIVYDDINEARFISLNHYN